MRPLLPLLHFGLTQAWSHLGPFPLRPLWMVMLYHDPTIRMRKTNYQSPPPPKPIAPRAGSYLARRICSRAGARCDAPIQEHRHDELCVRCFRVALSALGSAVQSLSEQCSAVPMDSPPSVQYCCNAYNVQRQCGHCGQTGMHCEHCPTVPGSCRAARNRQHARPSGPTPGWAAQWVWHNNSA